MIALFLAGCSANDYEISLFVSNATTETMDVSMQFCTDFEFECTTPLFELVPDEERTFNLSWTGKPGDEQTFIEAAGRGQLSEAIYEWNDGARYVVENGPTSTSNDLFIALGWRP